MAPGAKLKSKNASTIGRNFAPNAINNLWFARNIKHARSANFAELPVPSRRFVAELRTHAVGCFSGTL
jgi:hypothetical protein